MPQHRRTDATKTDQLSSLDSQEAVAPSPFAVQLLLLAVTGVTFTLSRGACRFTGLAEEGLVQRRRLCFFPVVTRCRAALAVTALLWTITVTHALRDACASKAGRQEVVADPAGDVLQHGSYH